MWTRLLFRRICPLLLTALLGGILGAILVRLAPGFGVDEIELNTRLREDSVQALRQSHSNERNSFRFFNKYLAGVANPVRLAPLLLVLVVVSCFQLLIPQEDFVS